MPVTPAVPAPARASVGGEMRTAAWHSAVYGLGSMLAKALGFLMVPFYTHYLSPAGYGVLEILDLSMSLLGMFLNMGLTAAMMRSITRAETEEEKRRVVSTGLLFTAATGIVTFACVLPVVKPLSLWLFGPSVPATYLLVSLASLALGYVANLPRTYLRALEASGTFVFIETASLFAMLALNVFFIAALGMDVFGILLSSLLVNSVQTVLLCWWAVRRAGISFSGPVLGEMIRFGLPLIFSNVGLFTLNFSDRFFLQHLQSIETVGVYAVGYKFAYMISYLLVQPFYVMWEVRMYVIHARHDHKRIFREMFMLYSLLLICATLGLSLLSPEIVGVMVDPRFAGSMGVIPVVALAYAFSGIGYCARSGMFLAKKTSLIGAVSAGAAVLNLILNFFLIQWFGMTGAAWATLLSFFAMAVGSYWCSERVLPMSLGGGRVCIALSLAVVLYLLSLTWKPDHLAAAVAFKVGLIGLFPVLVWKAGILSSTERDTVLSMRDSALAQITRRWQLLARKAAC